MTPANDIDCIDTPPIDSGTGENKDVAWQEFSSERRADRKRWGLYLGAGAAGLGALIGGVSVFAVVAALRDETATRNGVAAKQGQPPAIESSGRSEASSPLAESPVGRVRPCSYQDWLDKKCPDRNAAEPPRETTAAAPVANPPAETSPASAEPPVQAPVVTRISPAPAPATTSAPAPAPAASAPAPAQTQAAPAAAVATPQSQTPADPPKPYVIKVEPARIDPARASPPARPEQPSMNTAGAPPIDPSARAVDGKKKKQATRPRNEQQVPSTDGSAAPAATPLPPREGRTIEATAVETEPVEEPRGFFGFLFGGERREQVIVREPVPERAAPAPQRSRTVTREEAQKAKRKAARSRVVEDDDEEEAAPRQGRGVRVVVEEEEAPVERRPRGFFRFD